MLLLMTLVLLGSATFTQGLTTEQLALFEAHGWTITTDGSDYLFAHSGVVDTTNFDVGTFPNMDNPNTIQVQNYQIYVPQTPSMAGSPACTPAGYVGMAVNGAVFFNPLTIEGKDAVTGDCSEVFDSCQGHPDQQGTYHYHQIPECVASTVSTNEPIGIALDGYLIYLNVDENGNTLTSADLDECGGRTGTAGDYRYHMQTVYPYTMGCFKGTFSSRQSVRGRCLTLATCDACAITPMFGLISGLFLLWKIFG